MASITTRAGKGSALTWTEADANITNLNTAKIENVVEDTTPQLGGDLDVNGKNITSASNGSINITPNGSGNISLSPATGKIILGALDFPTGTGSNGQVLTTNGSSAMSWTTVSGGSSALNDLSDVVITAAATGDILRYDGTNWVDTAESSITVGTASVGSTVTLTADNTTNATNYPLFANAATGNLSPRTDTGFTYNPSTGSLTATTFVGALSGNATTATTATGATNINISTTTGNANDTTLYPVMVGANATGNQLPHIDITGMSFDATNNNLTLGSSGATNAGELTLFSNSTGSVALTAPTTTTTYTLTFPTTAGSANQVLTTNGSGTLSWTTPFAANGTFTGTINTTSQVTFNGGNGVNFPKVLLGTTAVSSTAWTTQGIGLRISAATFTDTSSTAGTVAASHVHGIAASTLASTNAITVTDAASLYIAEGPTAGTNTTITNKWALLTAGNIKAAGATIGGTTLPTATGLTGQVLALSSAGVAAWTTASGSGTVTSVSGTGTVSGLSLSGTVTSTGSLTLGGTLDLSSPGAIGATTASTGRFTTVTSTATTGTAPFVVASTTNVANLNASSLNGATFASPGAIGSTTASTGAFTTLSASSTVSGTGFSNYLASPPAIGGTTRAAGSFTTMTADTAVLDDIRETVFAGGTTTGTITPDAANGSIQTLTLTGNITLNAFANPVSGQTITFIITQSASGNNTLTSTMKFAGGSKTLTTTANAIDILTVSYIGTTYYASLSKGFA